MTRTINLNKIVPKPVIVEYGSLRIDVTTIPSEYAFRLMELQDRMISGEPVRNKEAFDIVFAAIQSTNPDVTMEQLRKSGSFAQLKELVKVVSLALMDDIDKYEDQESTGPLEHPEKIPMQ